MPDSKRLAETPAFLLPSAAQQVCARRAVIRLAAAIPGPAAAVDHGERAVGIPRPFLLRPVPVELDAVLVRIAEIERFADAVVARAVELDAGLDQPAERIGERGARRVEDGDVVEPGRAGGRRRAAFALPGVQADVVMIAAGRDEGGARAVALRSARSRARRNRRRARARCRRPSDAHGRCASRDRSGRRVRFPRCGLRWVCRALALFRLEYGGTPVAVTWRKPARLAARPRGA